MNESEQYARTLEILTDAYVKLNTLHTTPGEKCHMLASSIQWLQCRMKELLR